MLRRHVGPVGRLAVFALLAISLSLTAPAGFAGPPDGKGKPGGGGGAGGGGGGGKKHNPIAVDDQASVETGGVVDINVLVNDSDPNGDAISIVSYTQGQYGGVTDSGGGVLVYSANNTSGRSMPLSDSFTYVITDGQSKSRDATGTVLVAVSGLPPTADAGPPQSLTDTDGAPGETVVMDGSGSTDDGAIVTYAWSWPGGAGASGLSPSIRLDAGATTVTLTVTDNEGDSDQDDVIVTVTETNFPPTANAGADQTLADLDGLNGEPVTLNGAGSSDPDGAIATYAWSWPGGVASGTTPTVELPNGETVVTLTVTDNEGDTDSDTVTIAVSAPDLATVSSWGEAQVRRVLHACCYGGQATDTQIATWGGMSPEAAVAEIISFAYNNPLLSPPEDAFVDHNSSLYEMQLFWSGDSVDNPVRPDVRANYLMSPGDNFSMTNLERTWWEAVSQRGGNPFLHKIGFYITNHHYAASGRAIGALMQPYYDEVIGALADGASFTDVQYLAASSAALSRYYGHQYNRFYRNGDGLGGGSFYGNDDFAREYFQLGMRIDADDEYDYHENVTIENMAKVLSGMEIDREYGAYDSTQDDLEWVAPIVFDTHVDEEGRLIRNADSETPTTVFYNNADHTYYGYHHANCVEVLHAEICGANADQKIRAITDIASVHPETLANLPVRIVGYLFDDNLTPTKKAALGGAWAAMPQKDLLAFLRRYFTSTAFHAVDTYKYANGFDYLNRLWVNNTTSNADSHANARQARTAANLIGAQIFEPARAVFGAQTGLDIANGPNILLTLINRRVSNGYYLYEDEIVADGNNGLPADWRRDWGAVIPHNGAGEHVVGEVTDWLWNRFIGDSGENLGVVERAHIQSLLATGRDLNYRMYQAGEITLQELTDRHYNDGDPASGVPHTRVLFGTPELTDPGHPVYALNMGHANTVMDLDSADPGTQKTWNTNVGYAVNFIATLPFMFAFEGQ